MDPKGSQMVKNTWVAHFGSYWTLLYNFRMFPKYQEGSKVEKNYCCVFWDTLYVKNSSDNVRVLHLSAMSNKSFSCILQESDKDKLSRLEQVPQRN